jgi:hypothetical protein
VLPVRSCGQALARRGHCISEMLRGCFSGAVVRSRVSPQLNR